MVRDDHEVVQAQGDSLVGVIECSNKTKDFGSTSKMNAMTGAWSMQDQKNTIGQEFKLTHIACNIFWMRVYYQKQDV